MDQQQLAHFELLCNRLYNPTSTQERMQAEEALQPFSTRPEAYNQLRSVMDSTTSPVALHYSALSLQKLLSTSWNHFPTNARIDIRNHVLNLLATKGPSFEDYVLVGLIQVITKTTKLGWFDDTAHQTIFDEVQKFLKASSRHYYIGLKMLNLLVGEINDIQNGQNYTAHRKIANSFRDKALLKIFQASLTSLNELWTSNIPDVALQEKLKEQALELSFRCLSYDFIGTAPEDSVDDIGIVQIPSTWKTFFEDDSTIKLFLNIYANSLPPVSVQAMKCLVQIGSISRSAFNGSEERDRFLKYLMDGVAEVLRHRRGLDQQPNHHEFCRLLARMKGNYQISHITTAEGNYPEWMRNISQFTIDTFSNWEWSPNSVYYLLSFWSRLIISISYTKEGVYNVVQSLAPQIFKAFVESRMANVKKVVYSSNSDRDVMQDEEEMLGEQVEALPHLGRCNYEVASNYIIQLFDPLFAQYKQAIESRAINSNIQSFRMILGQISWIIQIIGSIVGGRNSAEIQDEIDGELVARVFEFIIANDASFSQIPDGPSKERLEKVVLDFIEQYRKGYIGDSSKSSTKILNKMSETLGLTTDHAVLGLIMSKIATTFKNWPEEEEIIAKGLNLLTELTNGYASAQKLCKLDVASQYLSFHTSQTFPFLDIEPFNRRTTYYNSLARLLFLDENISKFETFMEPFKQKLIYISDQLSLGNRSEQLRNGISGLLRDFCGILLASKRKAYCLIFDWLYPDYFLIFRKIAEVYFDDHDVIVPLLKLGSELAHNSGGRITFDASSVNGILLFREISGLLVSYGTRIYSNNPSDNIYKKKYKSIALSLVMLTRALLGNYLNFGVFELYGDPALSDALSVAIKLATSITMSQILAYPKLQKGYYSFIEVLSGSQTSIVAKLETTVFSGVMKTLLEGLDSFETGVVTQCAISVDRIISFSLMQNPKPKDLPLVNLMKQRVSENNELFCNIMEILLKKILFENIQNQWSLSRPILSLMLLNPQYFSQLESKLIEVQPADRRPQLKKHFEEVLMSDIQLTLDQSNREKFSQNLNSFNQEVRKYIVHP
eukprot:TRINITY_DN3708_c0_g1_i1.p1 TRINITY_DN3708_c0_g1~~TRINITY_DN3708_c0_g1_i1.p1  ORF type:complete len:1062 (-),score=375.41 TRINITY_DN3708_c0_g1_i1:42-3227(-)